MTSYTGMHGSALWPESIALRPFQKRVSDLSCLNVCYVPVWCQHAVTLPCKHRVCCKSYIVQIEYVRLVHICLHPRHIGCPQAGRSEQTGLEGKDCHCMHLACAGEIAVIIVPYGPLGLYLHESLALPVLRWSAPNTLPRVSRHCSVINSSLEHGDLGSESIDIYLVNVGITLIQVQPISHLPVRFCLRLWLLI